MSTTTNTSPTDRISNLINDVRLNPNDAQALVALATANLEKNLNNLNTTIADTVARVQTQQIDAEFAQASNQAYQSILSGTSQIAMGLGNFAQAGSAGKQIKDLDKLDGEYADKLNAQQQRVDDLTDQIKAGDNGPTLRMESSLPSDEITPDKDALRSARDTEKEKLKSLRDEKTAKREKISAKHNRNNSLAMMTGITSQGYATAINQQFTSETTRQRAIAGIATQNAQIVNRAYGQNNSLIQSTLQTAGNVYQVNIASVTAA